MGTAIIGIVMQVLGMGQSIGSTAMSYKMEQQAIQQAQEQQIQNLCPQGERAVAVTVHPDGSRTIECR